MKIFLKFKEGEIVYAVIGSYKEYSYERLMIDEIVIKDGIVNYVGFNEEKFKENELFETEKEAIEYIEERKKFDNWE